MTLRFPCFDIYYCLLPDAVRILLQTAASECCTVMSNTLSSFSLLCKHGKLHYSWAESAPSQKLQHILNQTEVAVVGQPFGEDPCTRPFEKRLIHASRYC